MPSSRQSPVHSASAATPSAHAIALLRTHSLATLAQRDFPTYANDEKLVCLNGWLINCVQYDTLYTVEYYCLIMAWKFFKHLIALI